MLLFKILNVAVAFGSFGFYGTDFHNPAIERELRSNQHEEFFTERLLMLRDSCQEAPGLKHLSIPRDHFQNNSAQFEYWYQLEKADPPIEDTVIFLPGGPGGASIGSDFLPDRFNRLKFDPRGVGCNFATPDDFAPNEVSTVQSVLDIIEVLRRENPESYIIYGHSYGTVTATILASEIAKKGLPPPMAVLLEGTMDDGWDSFEEMVREKASSNLVNKILKARDREAINRLATDRERRLILGFLLISSIQWPDEFNELLVKLREVSSDNFEEVFKEDIALWKNLQDSDRPKSDVFSFVHEVVSCTELAPDFYSKWYRYIWRDQQVEIEFYPSESGDVCGDLPFEKYNSAEHQIPFPLYYFHGTEDYTTPIRGALSHFKQQRYTGFKEFNRVEGAFHSPLQYELNDDLGEIIERIFREQTPEN